MQKPAIPTLEQLRERMLADLDYRLPAFRLRPAKSVVAVLVTVISSPIHSLYAFGHWMMDQLNPKKASLEWLLYWSDRLNVPRKDAIPANGIVVFSGELGGFTIPSGTRFRHPALPIAYVTQEDALLPAHAVYAAAETGGSEGNTSLLNGFVLESPVTGLSMDVEIIHRFAGGTDEEPLSAWASRIDEQLKERQKIGDADDYKRWAKASHPDISDAVVYENTPHLGFILIRVLGTAVQPVLDASVLEAAKDNLDQLRNMACIVNLSPVREKTITIKIADVTSELRPDIETDINDLMRSKQTFAAKLWPAEIERVIAAYSDTYTLLYPLSATTAADDEILTLGGITWH